MSNMVFICNKHTHLDIHLIYDHHENQIFLAPAM